MLLAHWLRRHSLEVQFWGYETGNVIASITGAGRPPRLRRQPRRGAALDRLRACRHGALARARASRDLRHGRRHGDRRRSPSPSAPRSAGDSVPRAADAVNALAVPLALALLAFAIARNANLFTVAACAFVVGSCLLRGAGHFPLLLKLGGPRA